MTTTTLRTKDGRQLCYAQWGDPAGAPIFSLHGTPGCRLNRYPDDEALANIGARVITYDRPGYGRSDRNPGRRVVDCVPDVEAIADAEGIDHFVVVGGSGGGPHALAVAARLPERATFVRCIVGIVPYDTTDFDWFAGMDPENIKEFGWALAGEETLYRELSNESEAMVARVKADASNVLGSDWELPEADRAVLAHPLVMQVMREAIPECVVNGPWGWVDDDLAFTQPWGFDISEIAIPAEVHYGSQDVLVPAAHGAWLATNVPSAKVVVNDDEGHSASPERTLELLKSMIGPH
jgi:pimeloyl-ACP methyl ester carboxylesterase